MYSEKPKNYWGPGVAILGVLVFGIILLFVYWQNETVPSGPTDIARPNPTIEGNPDPGVVQIEILTADTKAEWLRVVTEPFNAASHQTATGETIQVEITQQGSPGEAQQWVLDGEVQPTIWSPGDISWIETANQISHETGGREFVLNPSACPPLVYAATGFVMWRPMAEALGWPDETIGWSDIVALASDPDGWGSYGHPEWGQFTFGHPHPAHSSTGFAMMANLAYATLGKTSDLTPEDVKKPEVVSAFREVENNTYHYGLSTSGLTRLMVRQGPAYLHASTASETSTLWSNIHVPDDMVFQFAFIFPADGTFWSDNPACILDREWVTPEQREAAQIYIKYLLEPGPQDKAVEIGIRPADPDVPLHSPIALEMGTDPRVSPHTVPPLEKVSGETAAALLDVFDETKKKGTVIILLDTSGSMGQRKLSAAKDGTISFLDHLHRDDEIIIQTFNDDVRQVIPFGRVGEVAEELRETIKYLFAENNTALNDAICGAVDEIESLRMEDEEHGENRLYGIIVLSDGKDTISARTTNDMLNCLPTGEDVEGVRIYTIAYGSDADEKLLERVAIRTNGKFFTSDPENIDDVYLTLAYEQ